MEFSCSTCEEEKWLNDGTKKEIRPLRRIDDTLHSYQAQIGSQ